MAVATVGTLDVQGLVPRTLGPAAADRARRALGEPLADALGEAFDVLEGVDPGACWVIRSVHVHLDVPASEPDPARQARRIAAGLAEGLAQVVRAGPSAEAVRFAGQADHVAAWVRARLAGVGVGWVFDRFAAFDALPAPDALVAAARAVPVGLVEVVTALVGRHGWQALVDRSSAESLARLRDALVREVAGVVPGAGAVAAAREGRVTAGIGPPSGTVDVAGHVGAVASLRLVGMLAEGRELTPELVAAAVHEGARRGALGGDAHVDKEGRPDGVPSPGNADAPRADARIAPDAAPTLEVGWWAAPGAAAFLLLPDLIELADRHPVLAEPGPGALVRASVLAGVFGGSAAARDPAIALASGLDPRLPDDAWRGGLGGAVAHAARELAADDVLGLRHPGDDAYFAPVSAVDADLAVLSAALFRALAAHLPGFGHSGAGYLLPRVLPLGGRVQAGPDLVEALLPAPPLGVLLSLAGLDAFACRPPWLDVPVAVAHEVSP